MHNPVKIVVFDMDETLGYFVELGIFCEAINTYFKSDTNSLVLDQNDFNEILDLYPEFIRPNIYSILNYLKRKMITGELNGVMIYTNNQGPKVWVNLIKTYFESKINYKLFVQVITAFKVNGKQTEMCRTTHEKTLGDFIRCSKLPIDTQICFLDDTYYPNMNNENVYYIKVKPYVYDLEYALIVQRFVESKIGKKFLTGEPNVKSFYDYTIAYMTQFKFLFKNKIVEEYEIDKIVTKKIMVHLQSFFNKNKSYRLVKYKIKNTIRGKTYKNKTIPNR